ncbi:MAG: hypothetical protein U5L96_08525 [Owenweeksia sp.]|nr:hypothetical protein [Owenweeksia sp.]
MKYQSPIYFAHRDEKEGYRLLKLEEKTEPHRANMKTDYQRLQDMALQKKKNELIEEWVRSKLKTTYVRVNDDYLKCKFENDWLKNSQYVE